jgi:ANTAR domain
VIALLSVRNPAYVREAAKRGAFAYIVDGDAEELQIAIEITLQRFAEYQNLQGAFGRRALIEQAKGILMARHAIDQRHAFQLLRSHSQQAGRKLVDVVPEHCTRPTSVRRVRSPTGASWRCRSTSWRHMPVTTAESKTPFSMLKESLRILHDLGDPLGIAENLGRLARALTVAGSADAAARLLASSDVLYERTGGGVLSWVARMNEETLTTIRARLDDADFADAWEQGRALTLDQAVALALDS